MSKHRFADFLALFRASSKEPERARLAAILELNRSLAAAEDRGTLFTLLLDAAVRLFGAERGFLILAGEKPEAWSVAAARSHDQESIKHPDKKLSQTVVRRCLEEGAGVFSADAQEGEFGPAQSIADMRLRSVLSMPLVRGEKVLGCIYLDHRFQSGAFKAEDLPWLQAFADQAAIAVHLHALLEANREFARRLELRNQDLEQELAIQQRELVELRSGLAREQLTHAFPEFLGESPALLRALHLLDRLVPGDFPVLLVGESGTGKELAARALWGCGVRRSGPFVPVNVAAIAEGLLESELFGHEKGAYTGADRARLGLLREAHGGVLFLDEVTEMPLDVQVKLLRFLEDKQVRPLGAARSERVDVRIVAATNRPPLDAVAAGLFRQDLYYRLAVVTVELPPLRERRSDLPLLVAHFLGEAAAARGASVPRRASAELLHQIARRSWPGNVRQLRNEMLRLDALAAGDEIGAELLSPEAATPAARALDLASLERWAIEQALSRSGGNKAEAARLLGISRRALYNKLGP